MSCPLGALAPGSVATVSISGTESSYAGDTLANTATVASPDDDDPPADNSSTSTTPVAPSADLAIGKALVSGLPVAGGPGQYLVEVTNAGPSDAANVVVTDQVPAEFNPSGATLTGSAGSCGIDQGLLTCTLASVPVGAAPVITIDGTFTQALGATITNIARVSADTPDPITTNNTSTATGSVSESADLQLTKTGPTTVVAGDDISWQIQIHNAGPSDARDVTVNDSVPSVVTGATATVRGVDCAPTSCAIGDIRPAQTVTSR